MSYRCVVIVCLLVVAVGGGGSSARAQTAASDSARHHPNTVPYESNRSAIAHVLAAPSYVLHYATRPLGWAMVWVEHNFPGLFEGKRPAYGVLPLFELGGPVGVSGGVIAFHRNVWGRGHRARLSAEFGSRNYNDFVMTYDVPDPLGAGTTLEFRGRYFNDPGDRFFFDGNAATRGDETRYSVEQSDVQLTFRYQPSRRFGSAVALRYDHSTTKQPAEDFETDDPPIPRMTPGLGTVDRMTATVSFSTDRTRGGRRVEWGPRVRLGLAYSHELGEDRFRYGRYTAELHQFVPLPLLPKTRRFALRARAEQVASFGDRAVPFYALSRLGGQRSVRGFVTNRFSDKGSLLINAEYRYPIWSNLDAVFFFDAGQVFDAWSEVGLDRFHTSGGGGIHLLTSNGLAFRFEIARSREEVRTILTVQPLF